MEDEKCGSYSRDSGNEVIEIGDGIKIKVFNIHRDSVRLGVVAPGLSIDREEVAEAKRREAKATAQVK